MRRKTLMNDVLNLIRESPGLSVAELARRLDRDPPAVRVRVNTLEEQGVIETRPASHPTRRGIVIRACHPVEVS